MRFIPRSLVLALVLALSSVPLAAQNGRPGTFTTVVLTDGTSGALRIGCAVGSTTCMGGILAGSVTSSSGTLTITNSGEAALDVAGGIQSGSGNVRLTGADGRIPGISSGYFASTDGSSLTGLRPDALTGTGWVPSSAIFGTYSNQVSFTNSLNTFTAFNVTVSNLATMTSAAITNLSGTAILVSGSVHGGSVIADTTLAAGGAITGASLTTSGVIQAVGGYKSADGTTGTSGACASTTTITVKNGLITGCS